MKKLVQTTTTFAVIAATWVALLPTAHAVLPGEAPVNIDVPNQVTPVSNNPTSVFDNIFNFVFGLVGSITVLALIVSGIRYMTAYGNKSRLETAKNNLTYSIIGFVIFLLAYVIARTVDQIL